MNYQRIAILGSTGSIGTQVLEIVRQHPDLFDVIALTTNKNWKLLAQQIKEFKPRRAIVCDSEAYTNLKQVTGISDTELVYGEENLKYVAALPEVDTVVNSLVGFVGFESTMQAVESNKKLALANKESLVVGGALINKALENGEASLLPIDSEHSAMLQSIVGEQPNTIEKIVITASGGPFRDFSLEQLKTVTLEQALKHPNWEMGAKITIDSSTLMNKGLEIIEAYWLFDIGLDNIEPVIHPQSIIHSIVTFIDGSSKAQLGPPDMKVPIIYALTYPDRLPLDTPRLDWTQNHELTFSPVDFERFPCVKLAMEAIRSGGYAPAVLNAANEIAVQRFLDREIGYIDIPRVVYESLDHIHYNEPLSIENLKYINQETRNYAASVN